MRCATKRENILGNKPSEFSELQTVTNDARGNSCIAISIGTLSNRNQDSDAKEYID